MHKLQVCWVEGILQPEGFESFFDNGDEFKKKKKTTLKYYKLNKTREIKAN